MGGMPGMGGFPGMGGMPGGMGGMGGMQEVWAACQEVCQVTLRGMGGESASKPPQQMISIKYFINVSLHRISYQMYELLKG